MFIAPTFFFIKKFNPINMNISVFDYTAKNNPKGSAELVSKWGERPSKNISELSKQLQRATLRNGEKGWMQIARIHPDRPLYEKLHENIKKWEREEEDKKTPKYSNACGCSASYSNATGQEIKSEISSIKENSILSNKSELMIMGGVILLGLALILKK